MPVSINEHSSSAPAAAHTPMQPGSRQEAASHEAAELDVWEDEGGTTLGRPPEVPRPHAGRQFDEFAN
jgi:hypothetical protein